MNADELKVAYENVQSKILEKAKSLEKSISDDKILTDEQAIEKLKLTAEEGIGACIVLYNLLEDEAERRGASVNSEGRLSKSFDEIGWLIAKFELIQKRARGEPEKIIEGYA